MTLFCKDSLYDVNTYTYITINAGKEIALPALIEGVNSNGGYLKTAMTNTDTQMVLYQVSGTFNEREPLKVNGKKLVEQPKTLEIMVLVM